MTTSTDQSMTDKFHTWVKTVAIICAGIWAAYTFVYKEILLPKAAPINISVDLQLKKIGMTKPDARRNNSKLVAIEARVVATNPSSRTVYLFPSAWVAYGIQVTPVSASPTFHDQASFSGTSEIHATSHSTVVGVGSLIPDSTLQPNETIKRTLIFHVPYGTYDHIALDAFMPSMGKKNGAALEWAFDENTQSLDIKMYRVNKSGERSEMQKDKDGSYSDEKLEFQMTKSRNLISLWE